MQPEAVMTNKRVNTLLTPVNMPKGKRSAEKTKIMAWHLEKVHAKEIAATY
jgi:hypothetical protein